MSLARALELCGFRPRETFSVAAIRDREIRPGCFVSVVEAEAFLEKHAGWSLYFCGNPVAPGTEGKPGTEDITDGRVLLVDCDPERGPAGEADGGAARAAVLELAAFLEQRVGSRPAVEDSGRGTQAWLRVEGLDPAQRRRLARGLAVKFGRDGARFDGTHNLDRLMRLPGSVNPKTGRIATILDEGNGRAITVEDLERLDLPEALEVASDAAPADFGAPLESDLARVTGEAKRLWDAPAAKGGRSKRDFLFSLALLRGGATEAITCRLLWAMPGSKAREDRRGENYWTSTLASVRRHLAEEERKRALALSLPDAAETDPGAPLEPAALDALLFVRETDGPAAWARLRARLKGAKVGLQALEKAMASRKSEQVNAEEPPLRYVTANAKRVGWFKETIDGAWSPVDGSDVRSTLRSRACDVDGAVDRMTSEPWSLVNEPFQPEELDGRRWNKDGARLAFEPLEGPHPTWDMIFSNLGRNLDGAVEADEWCRASAVKTSADYLRAWVAAMIQRPKDRLAYLFFHGEQEAGKSLFHEALKPLFTRGYQKANHALTSKDGFNGEIANAVLCVVEEVDLSDQRKYTAERIKEWVTGKTISVRALYCQAFDLENATHWVQCANKVGYMAVLPGDTRITSIHVERVSAAEAVPKEELLDRLLAEAPAFLWTVSRMPLPPATGRLRVPALSTSDKAEQEKAARTDLEAWLEEREDVLELKEIELVGAFLESLTPGSRTHWDRGRVLREIPPEVRRDRRLVGALVALGPRSLKTSDLLAILPADARRDFTSPVALGRGLARLAPRLGWLEHRKSTAGEVWQLNPVAAVR